MRHLSYLVLGLGLLLLLGWICAYLSGTPGELWFENSLYFLLASVPVYLLGSFGSWLLNQKLKGWIPSLVLAAGIGSLSGWLFYQQFLGSHYFYVPEGELLFFSETKQLWFSLFAGFTSGLGFFIGLRLPFQSIFGRFEFDFARRITFRNQRSISRLVVILGILSIALGVAVMEVAISIVFGFQTTIENKVIGFGSHVQIGNLLEDLDSEKTPLPLENEFLPLVRGMGEVASVTPFTTQPALLKKEAQEGVLMHGVDKTYDWRFFAEGLKEGRLPDYSGERYSKEVLISTSLARLIDAKIGDKVFAFFFQQGETKVRTRDLKVVGIYETGLEEFDRVQVFCDLRVVQRILRWEPNEVQGFEVRIHNPDLMEAAAARIDEMLPYQYEARSASRIYPEIFEWVELQHQNVWFILGIMILIAVINMCAVILIVILERTRTIGLLKTMGLSNLRVESIFVANAFFLILLGIALGNLLGMGLIASQDLFGWLSVDQANYFVKTVPVQWAWDWFLWVNIGVVLVCTLFMYLPALVIARVSPIKALRFD